MRSARFFRDRCNTDQSTWSLRIGLFRDATNYHGPENQAGRLPRTRGNKDRTAAAAAVGISQNKGPEGENTLWDHCQGSVLGDPSALTGSVDQRRTFPRIAGNCCVVV